MKMRVLDSIILGKGDERKTEIALVDLGEGFQTRYEVRLNGQTREGYETVKDAHRAYRYLGMFYSR